jgi:hypothetical protein
MNGLRNVRRAFVAQHVWMVFAALFLWVSGFSFFVSFNQAFLIAKFGWSAQQIGTFFAYIGVWIIVAQAVVVYQSRRTVPGVLHGMEPLIVVEKPAEQPLVVRLPVGQRSGSAFRPDGTDGPLYRPARALSHIPFPALSDTTGVAG